MAFVWKFIGSFVVNPALATVFLRVEGFSLLTALGIMILATSIVVFFIYYLVGTAVRSFLKWILRHLEIRIVQPSLEYAQDSSRNNKKRRNLRFCVLMIILK